MRPDDWYSLADLDAFLTRAGAFLRSRPALHTVSRRRLADSPAHAAVPEEVPA